jgi:hypothetical protein
LRQLVHASRRIRYTAVSEDPRPPTAALPNPIHQPPEQGGLPPLDHPHFGLSVNLEMQRGKIRRLGTCDCDCDCVCVCAAFQRFADSHEILSPQCPKNLSRRLVCGTEACVSALRLVISMAQKGRGREESRMLTEGVGVEPSVALVWVSTAAGVLVTGAGGGAAEHAGDRAGSACQAASGVMHRVRSRGCA